MNNTLKEYLSYFFILSNEIEILLNEFEHEWGEDEDPPYIFLFSKVGKVIANNISYCDDKERLEIFSHIESGINSGDEYLSTAVATGLIEALVNTSDGNPELWDRIEDYLGTESKKYALAWKNFGQ
ncbi:hypothetical protein A9G42_08345 [Gilliamella sp. Nev6-6]|jgi:hypothetical protein|uniref:DUF7674 family protein n=1 Tax=Gilliamella sp. Nev6-6 TaxID=3120252 RepID=UPI00080F56C4|nr:hypothetical protein [Gilliamella apicola]OCG76239.1 hypothetical protein A9G42_08345 [Gilliamella apicola]